MGVVTIHSSPNLRNKAARIHILALEHLLAAGETIAINLASGQGISVRQAIETARVITGLEIATRDFPRRPGDPPILIAEAALARKLLGWSVERSKISIIVNDAWRWHKERFLTKNDRSQARADRMA